MALVVDAIGAGAPVCIAEGPDDICLALHARDRHCERDSVAERDRRASELIARLCQQTTAHGATLVPQMLVARLRDAFRRGDNRDACQTCEWHELCTALADRDFSGVRLQLPPGLVERPSESVQPAAPDSAARLIASAQNSICPARPGPLRAARAG